MKQIFLISILIVFSQATCSLLIQKFQLPQEIILIQSECKLKEIKDSTTNEIIDMTRISENQVIIEASKIDEQKEYKLKLKNKGKQGIDRIKIKIVQNTDTLKPIQEQLNKHGIQKDYKIVVSNLLSDIFWGLIKGALLVFL